VSERLIDLAELVEVDHEHAARLVVPVPGRDRLIQPVAEERTVRKPGQLVVERPPLECLGVRPAARDVPDAADRERPVADLHLAHVDLHREQRAVLAAADRLGRRRGDVVRGQQPPRVAHRIGEAVVVRRRDDELERLPDRLVLAIAEQAPR
jgi:hypothetical protein